MEPAIRPGPVQKPPPGSGQPSRSRPTWSRWRTGLADHVPRAGALCRWAAGMTSNQVAPRYLPHTPRGGGHPIVLAGQCRGKEWAGHCWEAGVATGVACIYLRASAVVTWPAARSLGGSSGVFLSVRLLTCRSHGHSAAQPGAAPQKAESLAARYPCSGNEGPARSRSPGVWQQSPSPAPKLLALQHPSMSSIRGLVLPHRRAGYQAQLPDAAASDGADAAAATSQLQRQLVAPRDESFSGVPMTLARSAGAGTRMSSGSSWFLDVREFADADGGA